MNYYQINKIFYLILLIFLNIFLENFAFAVQISILADTNRDGLINERDKENKMIGP